MWNFIEDLIDRPIFGVFAMALLGGLLAHMRTVAKDMPELKTREDYRKWVLQCTYSFFIKTFGAMLGAMFVLYFWKAQGWRWEYGFIAAGVFGMFSSEMFEWIFAMGKGWFQRFFNVTPSKD